jgi:nucleoside 2-deoxyribosyltransferase
MSKRVYLAGPEVFLSNAREIGALKRRVCERHGLVGVFPADEEDACDPALPLPEQGLAISRAMERVMRGCDAMIVNLTPFRGPSADVGSAYEMGFMRALGRAIFAYSNDARPFIDRVAAFCGAVRMRPTGNTRIPTAWRSSRSRCMTTSCSLAASSLQVAISSPKRCRTPNATFPSPCSDAVSRTPRRNCSGSVWWRPTGRRPRPPCWRSHPDPFTDHLLSSPSVGRLNAFGSGRAHGLGRARYPSVWRWTRRCASTWRLLARSPSLRALMIRLIELRRYVATIGEFRGEGRDNAVARHGLLTSLPPTSFCSACSCASARRASTARLGRSLRAAFQITSRLIRS